ncbi:MAG TPA: trehalose-phosphatase [Candidatus Polarisedimenticolia bacterium]|jgi:trehalose-phosphatase|nr:trehalose-phosphatase [Candidatus Polarisedimenticolia bacterium]
MQKRVLLLFDFDGTLAPLSGRNDAARLSEEIRGLLGSLQARPGVGVAVLSGRSLKDLQARVDMPALYYGGNHGLEIAGPGISFRHAGAVARRSIVQDLAARIESDLGRVPGASLENKGLTLSVHYRRVARRSRRSLAWLRSRIRVDASGLPVRWGAGRKVWELLPRVKWHKGAASLYLMRHLGNPFPIALGDDTTDEDIFSALKGRGLSIRVGRLKSSRADYYLIDQGQVARFLRETRAALEGRG